MRVNYVKWSRTAQENLEAVKLEGANAHNTPNRRSRLHRYPYVCEALLLKSPSGCSPRQSQPFYNPAIKRRNIH